MIIRQNNIVRNRLVMIRFKPDSLGIMFLLRKRVGQWRLVWPKDMGDEVSIRLGLCPATPRSLIRAIALDEQE